MDIIRLSAAIIAVSVMTLLLKKYTPAIALVLALGMGVLVILSLIPQLKSIISLVEDIGGMTGEDSYASILFKIIGIAYVAQFAADLCTDAGESSLASRAVLAGKIFIVFYGMPIVAGLVDRINTMFT